jgi:hypothetical protein
MFAEIPQSLDLCLRGFSRAGLSSVPSQLQRIGSCLSASAVSRVLSFPCAAAAHWTECRNSKGPHRLALGPSHGPLGLGLGKLFPTKSICLASSEMGRNRQGRAQGVPSIGKSKQAVTNLGGHTSLCAVPAFHGKKHCPWWICS